MSPVPALAAQDLNVWFDLSDGEALHAVRGVSFALDRGERMGLVGESGCGKSTSILALMGLLPPSATVSGRILLEGTDILGDGETSIRPTRWRDIAMVFQGAMNAFNPVRRIGDQIAEPLLIHGLATKRQAQTRARELLEFVGIPASRADSYPHELSGGMRQRAAIALALICEPTVLLADEPTTALDVMVQAQILQLLARLSDELGIALILVTHDLTVMAQICPRAAVMYAGRVVESGPLDALYHDPRHPYTRLLFAATPDLLGEHPIASIPGTPPRLDRAPTGCTFAPRCDRAFASCGHGEPALREVGSAQLAACYLNEPEVAR